MSIEPEITELRVGDIVGDTQRMVVAYHKIADRVIGDTYATWVAICHKKDVLHPYVVWNVISTPRGLIAESGTYCSTITEAVAAYDRRVPK